MKHCTHIYLAMKAVELLKQSVDSLRYTKKRVLRTSRKTKERRAATELQRIFNYYLHNVREATWAPDDVLHDNDPNHIFKLFTDEEFPNHGLEDVKQKFVRDDVIYYKFAGALPFRVDHIAQSIRNMFALRDFNDQFQLRQIMYQFMLLSHYIVDAHVPMHCDLRDDPPKKGRQSDPSKRLGSDKPAGKYMNSAAHAHLEGLWDDAVIPVALAEGLIKREWVEQSEKKTEYSDAVTFSYEDCSKRGIIRTVVIPEYGLMDFMIDVCVRSKKRGQRLFAIDNPEVLIEDNLEEITRELFADCISSLISIWSYAWRIENR